MLRNFYFILISLISCNHGSNQTESKLSLFKQDRYNSVVKDFLKLSNISLLQNDTLILYEPANCIECVQTGIYNKLELLDNKSNFVLVFSASDSIYIQDLVSKDLKILVESDTFLKKNNVIHSSPYKYFFESTQTTLKGIPF